MTEVNWDDALYEAENSPRSVLTQALEYCDNMRCVIIVSVSNDSVREDQFRIDMAGGRFEVMGSLLGALDWMRNGCPDLEDER